VFNGSFVPHLKPDVIIVVASGYNVLFKLLEFKPTHNVVMVAPRFVLIHVRGLPRLMISGQDDWVFRALVV
jgi:ketol-acid reductoisomerase